ncbi:Piso0_005034 [Millerozyma farinosa CBS 7064]|uniref:Piso0_005034 protein n=1 Tax=Pichia sorbitophila (strain ATCC MYA-4447 / BCRC 22081 / CBS 7064 / NBRC 10061 / NRRL Y-12695) TaxID=559304 RepID=G8Y420_PICSO|nr:Piso0_005034 [Millerozyma farinosa CBS 7064]
MADVKKQDKRNNLSRRNANIDSFALGKLSAAVANQEELDDFIKSGLLDKVVSAWTYYGATNDHTCFNDLTRDISNFSRKASSYKTEESNVKGNIIDFYKEILDHGLKFVYRCLAANKPSITNPIIRLLKNIVDFDKSLVTYFLDNFDLGISTLTRLLVPSKADMEKYAPTKDDPQMSKETTRANLIDFWFHLNSIVPGFIRKDLLSTHYKIMNNIWKHMHEIDSLATLDIIFSFIDKNILDEATYKKSTKCKILNENFMHKAYDLFRRIESSGNKDLLDRYSNLLMKVTTDQVNGLSFPTHRIWQEGQSGVSITYNNKKFRVSNKLIMSFLTSMKPWESAPQLRLTAEIAKKNPDLIAPYLNWIIQNGGGYHDPSLTSWWIGHTLLYFEITSLEVPELSPHGKFNSKMIIEYSCPAPLGKNTLKRCLESDNKLIVQLSLQLIISVLLKVQKILAHPVLKENPNFNNQEYLELLIDIIPDFSYLCQKFILDFSQDEKDNKANLICVSLVKVLNLYQSVYVSSNSSLSSYVNDYIKKFVETKHQNSSNPYSLLLLDELLTLQLGQQDDQEFKWWNKAKNSNSFFTSLLRLSQNKKYDQDFSLKFVKVLDVLTSDSFIFNADLLVTPIFALMSSLRYIDVPERIWDYIDEVISRSLKSPYRYIDISHFHYDDISLFTIVAVEQFKFVLKDDKTSTKEKNESIRWLFEFLKYSFVVGEKRDAIIKLVNDYTNEMEREGLELDFWKDNMSKINETDSFVCSYENSSPSFSDFILSSGHSVLTRKKAELENRFPISDFDLGSLILRLESIIMDTTISANDPVFTRLLSKFGNYILGVIPENAKVLNYIISPKFLKRMIFSNNEDFDHSITEKSLMVSKILHEILESLNTEKGRKQMERLNSFPALKEFLEKWLSFPNALTLESQYLSSLAIWVLSYDDTREILGKVNISNHLTLLSVLKYAVELKIPLSSDNFKTLLSLPVETGKDSSNSKLKVVEGAVSNKLVEFNSTDTPLYLDIALKGSPDLLNIFLTKTEDSVRTIALTYLTSKAANEASTDDKVLFDITYSMVSSGIEIPESADGNNGLLYGVVSSILNLWDDTIDNKGYEFSKCISILKYALKYELVRDHLIDVAISKLNTLKDTPKEKLLFKAEFGGFIHELLKQEKYETNPLIHNWLPKSVLFITKRLATTSGMSDNLRDFICSFRNIVELLSTKGRSLWSIVPSSLINAQLEVILGSEEWTKVSDCLTLANSMIFDVPSSGDVSHEKLLQIFVNNPSNILLQFPSNNSSYCRFQCALIIFNLFFLDPAKNSTVSFMQSLTDLYLGSLRIEDLLIKHVLKKLEEVIMKSWANSITQWDLAEELPDDESRLFDHERLIHREKKDDTSLVISLNKTFINNSIEFGYVDFAKIDLIHEKELQPGLASPNKRQLLDKMYDNNVTYVNHTYASSTYDPEFFLMLVLNSEEFIRTETEGEEGESTKKVLDVKKLAEFGVLQYAIVSLSFNDPQIAEVSRSLINGVIRTLDQLDKLKEKNILKIYFSNILFTLKTSPEKVPPLIWYFYSSMLPIIIDSCHHLYEYSVHYILSNPVMWASRVPLLKYIRSGSTGGDESSANEQYYRNISWLVQRLINGTRSKEDLPVIVRSGLIEWILNMMNSPYISHRLEALILEFVSILQELENGSDTLITKYAMLTSASQIRETHSNDIISNPKTKVEREQIVLNIDQLLLRFGISVGSSKRIRDWTKDDMSNVVKRLRTDT